MSRVDELVKESEESGIPLNILIKRETALLKGEDYDISDDLETYKNEGNYEETPGFDFAEDFTTEDEEAQLLDAAANGETEAVKLLIEAGADVNAKDDDGCTPLHLAAIEGHTDTARLLIEAGADVNGNMDECGPTPLHCAAEFANTETTRLLIEAGADIDAKASTDSCVGYTPLHYAAGFLADSEDHTETARLLIEAGADINALDEDGWTPLHLAARFANAETVRLLVEKGADVSAEEKDGQTPLQLASAREHTEIIDILRKAGAD